MYHIQDEYPQPLDRCAYYGRVSTPSQHIEDIENVEIVFKDGIGFDAPKLMDSIKGRFGQY